MHNEKLFHIILHTKGISFKDCPKILNTAMSKTVDTRTTLCFKPAETGVFFWGGGESKSGIWNPKTSGFIRSNLNAAISSDINFDVLRVHCSRSAVGSVRSSNYVSSSH